MAESVLGLYKTECTKFEGPWRGVDDLELATLNWVHSSLDHVPPVEFEADYYYRQNNSRQQPLSGELTLY